MRLHKQEFERDYGRKYEFSRENIDRYLSFKQSKTSLRYSMIKSKRLKEHQRVPSRRRLQERLTNPDAEMSVDDQNNVQNL